MTIAGKDGQGENGARLRGDLRVRKIAQNAFPNAVQILQIWRLVFNSPQFAGRFAEVAWIDVKHSRGGIHGFRLLSYLPWIFPVRGGMEVASRGVAKHADGLRFAAKLAATCGAGLHRGVFVLRDHAFLELVLRAPRMSLTAFVAFHMVFNEFAVRLAFAAGARAARHFVVVGARVSGLAFGGLIDGRGHADTWLAASHVTFKPLTDKIIDEYVRLVNPLDKAGAYGIQSHGEMLVERVDGLMSNVIGLPVEEVVERLEKMEW